MSHVKLDGSGRCARCVAGMHCHGRVGACRCDCTGAPTTDTTTDAYATFGTRGVVHGLSFAWCEHHAHYLYVPVRARAVRGARGKVRLTWRDRIAAPGSDVHTLDIITHRANVASMVADAARSRDRHGATPSAEPCIRREVAPVSLTDAARRALARADRLTSDATRDDDEREREAWRVAFDARLASRDAR